MFVYKLLRAAEWVAFDAAGVFAGSADDVRDGYIHLSTAAQVDGTRDRYFAREPGVMMVTLDGDALGDALRWEPSRGGALFPHLYRAIVREDIMAVEAMLQL